MSHKEKDQGFMSSYSPERVPPSIQDGVNPHKLYSFFYLNFVNTYQTCLNVKLSSMWHYVDVNWYIFLVTEPNPNINLFLFLTSLAYF